jgi:hypothetical protein
MKGINRMEQEVLEAAGSPQHALRWESFTSKVRARGAVG